MKKERKEIEKIIKKFMELLEKMMIRKREEEIILDKFWDKYPEELKKIIQHFVETFKETLIKMKIQMKLARSIIKMLQNDIDFKEEKLKELIDEIKIMKEEFEMIKEMQISLNNESVQNSSPYFVEMKQFIEFMNNFLSENITFQRFFINEIEKLLDNVFVDVEINFKNVEADILQIKSKITKRSFLALVSQLKVEKNTKLKPSTQFKLNKGAYIDKRRIKFKLSDSKK